jgi:ribosomal protein S18 acetylase RimI-like enzyme
MRIRPANLNDLDTVIQITKDNNHYWTSEVDGKEPLTRILERDTNVFLVSESLSNGKVVGFIIGTWDGARAIIHKISVKPDVQMSGIGRALVNEAILQFKDMGAPTVGVTAADNSFGDEKRESTGFWTRLGFEMIPARLMIKFDIWSGDDENK